MGMDEGKCSLCGSDEDVIKSEDGEEICTDCLFEQNCKRKITLYATCRGCETDSTTTIEVAADTTDEELEDMAKQFLYDTFEPKHWYEEDD